LKSSEQSEENDGDDGEEPEISDETAAEIGKCEGQAIAILSSGLPDEIAAQVARGMANSNSELELPEDYSFTKEFAEYHQFVALQLMNLAGRGAGNTVKAYGIAAFRAAAEHKPTAINFENLGVALGMNAHFEEAAKMYAKAFAFKERYQIASSSIPSTDILHTNYINKNLVRCIVVHFT
jgi:hypothetical protein